MFQGGIARAREAASLRAEVNDFEIPVSCEDRSEALVVVLIHDDDAEPSMRLSRERVEEEAEIVRAVDRGDDEVEGESVHGTRGYRRPPIVSDRPLVSVLVSVHDGADYVVPALESVLRQTVRDLELVVVDDASTDATSALLDRFGDPRLVVVRNPERVGLAASLNRGLDRASGHFLARMDGDDVAFPHWLERQLRELRERPGLSAVGSGVVDLDAGGPGMLHELPRGLELRWQALFSSPFLHNTVVLERAALVGRGLRYDPSFEESEDYELWTRLLAHVEGDNVPEPLVLYRRHGAQASARRHQLQRRFQQKVALREIHGLAADLGADVATLAWLIGSGQPLPRGREREAADAFLELLSRFEHEHGRSRGVRSMAARALARAGLAAHGHGGDLLLRSLRVDAAWPLRVVSVRARRRVRERSAHRGAQRLLRSLAQVGSPISVAAVFPEPTPYRAPLLDRVAEQPEVDLTVIYAAATVAGRTWRVEPRHRAVFLRGLRVPGATRVLRHDYPVSLGIVGALRRSSPYVVVVSGWSTFAAQAAVAWCRRREIPYVLVVESHDIDPRPGWRRAVKRAVVPRIVRGASSVLVTGTAARESMIERGAAPDSVRVFANTVDVEAFGLRADALAPRRHELREGLGVSREDVLVLSVGRLAPEKGMDTLVHAAAAVGDPRVVLVLAGDGPEHERLQALAEPLGVRLMLAGDRPWERIVELYAAADVFALLSSAEPWGVVVNEAAACGLPLLLSDRVGAGYDLLRDGENGIRVPAGDAAAAADGLQRLLNDEGLRRRYGARAREIVRDWGYGPSVEAFVAAVRQGAAERRRR